MNDEDKKEKIIRNIEEEIDYAERSINKKSYQPTEDSLDPNDPPSGGSGVPNKNDDE